MYKKGVMIVHLKGYDNMRYSKGILWKAEKIFHEEKGPQYVVCCAQQKIPLEKQSFQLKKV